MAKINRMCRSIIIQQHSLWVNLCTRKFNIKLENSDDFKTNIGKILKTYLSPEQAFNEISAQVIGNKRRVNEVFTHADKEKKEVILAIKVEGTQGGGVLEKFFDARILNINFKQYHLKNETIRALLRFFNYDMNVSGMPFGSGDISLFCEEIDYFVHNGFPKVEAFNFTYFIGIAKDDKEVVRYESEIKAPNFYVTVLTAVKIKEIMAIIIANSIQKNIFMQTLEL